jgi:hypothetical protein
MTLQKAQELVAKFTYKPNFKIELQQDILRDMWQLHIHMIVSDVHTGKVTKVNSTRLLHCKVDKDYLKDSIISAVHELEIHEINEWLKFNGKHVTNPHPELAS